jgi:hypothetical protein
MALAATTGTLVAQTYPSIHGPESTPHYPAAGSTYVPLESWVYPAIERLAALRYVRSEFRTTRPWTRTECARLTDEAGDRIQEIIRDSGKVPEDVAETYKALEQEFARELDVMGGDRNRSLQMESAYARVMSMSGPVLDDSFNFGQTISNDYGRPDREGTDAILGASARATYGPFFGYIDQEYQHAPAQPNYSPSIQDVVTQMNIGNAVLPHGAPPVNRLQSLDTYIGVNFKNWQISYGRQSLWWGTSESGPLLFSNNIDPIDMFRINRVVPFRLPSILNFLGPIRVDFMVGKLGGQINPVSPWLQSLHISLKPTENFEFGVTHSAMFGGNGFPNGLGVFFRAFFPINRVINQLNDDLENKQYMSFDFQYRFKRYVTFYSEFLGSDDPEPFSEPSRDAVNTGVYFARLPWVGPKFDLRLEGVYTASPLNTSIKPNRGFLHYWGVYWQSGYTNDGDIIGNAIGRDGIRYQGWLTYHLSPKNSLQLNVGHTEINPEFVPSGANWMNYTVKDVQNVGSGFYVSSLFQVEHLNYLVLFTAPRTNVTASLEMGFMFGNGHR